MFHNTFGTIVACLVLICVVDGLQQYFCNSQEKIDQIKSLNTSLRRLVQHEDRLYFVFKDRTISTALSATEEKGHYKFLSLDFQEQEVEEENSPDSIGSEQRVFGYFSDAALGETSELYFVDANQDRTAEQVNNPVHKKRYVLSFEDGQVKRTRLDDVDPTLMKELASQPNVIYFNGLRTTDAKRQLLVKYSWGLDESDKDIEHALQIGISDYPKPNLVKYQPDFGSFVFHLFRMVLDDDREGSFDDTRNDTKYGHFMGVQKKAAALQFFVFFLPKRAASKIHEFEMDAEDLFNCYTPVQDLDKHLAGVYYDAPKKLWFVFVKRFYMKIDRDLLDGEFDLDEADYHSGRELEAFRSSQFIELARFRQLFRPVKSVLSQGYFSAFKKFEYSMLNVDDEGELKMTENLEMDLSDCSQTTLVIDDHLYCWDELDYTHLYQISQSNVSEYTSYSIAEIFAGTELDWKGQLVKLVFHYDAERFIVMTVTNLFVFEYAHFQVDPDNRIVHSYNETGALTALKMRNCLLPQNCANSLPKRQDKFFRNLLTQSTMVLLVVAIVVIFGLLLWTFRRDSKGGRSERAQYFLNVVTNLSKKSLSKLSLGDRIKPTSQAGSLGDIPAEHVKPKKGEVLAKVVKGLKAMKNMKDLKLAKDMKRSAKNLKSNTSTRSLSSQASLRSRSTTDYSKSRSTELKSKMSDKDLKRKKSDKELKSKMNDKDLKRKKSDKDLKRKKSDKELKSKTSDKDLKSIKKTKR